MEKIIIKFTITFLIISYAVNIISYNQLSLIILCSLSIAIFIDLIPVKMANILFVIYAVISLLYPPLIYAYPLIYSSAYKLNKGLLLIPMIMLLLTKQVDFMLIGLSLLAYIADYLSQNLSYYKTQIYQNEDYYNLQIQAENAKNSLLMAENKKDIEIALLKERNKISKEIHDSVGHTISAAIIQTEAIKLNSNRELEQQLNELQANLKNGMASIRKSLHQMHDSSLNLQLELEELINQTPQIAIELHYNLSAELSYEAKYNIILIVKEAIANSIKHSNADKIKISIIDSNKHLRIKISDNGKAENKENHQGIGFLSFQEFAHKHKGRFQSDFKNGANLFFLLDKQSLMR